MKKIGVLRFWGTNCDADVEKWVLQSGYNSEFLWFSNRFNINDFEGLIIPGGFSYGDYLRCGALAARSPAMQSLAEYALKGGPVLGICNGFQILCESGLLPGALVKNLGGRFIDDFVEMKVENDPNAKSKNLKIFSDFAKPGSTIKLPIAHGEGRFYAPADTLRQIEDQGQVWLRYVQSPNGSLNQIAGLMNKTGNVVGLMPHPERAVHSWMGSTDEIGRAHV